MGIKRGVRSIIKKLTGKNIYTALPFGVDPLKDVQHRFPQFKFSIIFDVGSNIGQTARVYKAHFPDAMIYCFEPVSSTFGQLSSNMKRIKGIRYFQLGFGNIRETRSIMQGKDSDMNSLVQRENDDPDMTQDIEIDTLSAFCNIHKITHINYLKIDTEGYDLKVLKGGVQMLDSQAIDFIEVEAGMNPGNTLHVPFDEIKRFLEDRNYFLFGIYEQVQEWKIQKPVLRRTNPLFISSRMVNH